MKSAPHIRSPTLLGMIRDSDDPPHAELGMRGSSPLNRGEVQLQ